MTLQGIPQEGNRGYKKRKEAANRYEGGESKETKKSFDHGPIRSPALDGIATVIHKTHLKHIPSK